MIQEVTWETPQLQKKETSSELRSLIFPEEGSFNERLFLETISSPSLIKRTSLGERRLCLCPKDEPPLATASS